MTLSTIPLPDNTPRYFQHVTLKGSRQLETAESPLQRIKRKVETLSIANGLADEQVAKLPRGSTACNAEMRTKCMRKDCDARKPVTTKLARRVRISFGERFEKARVPEIFEEKEKNYEDLRERFSWQYRINMIKAAFYTHHVYSISIVPTDPDEPQTWYDRKSYSNILMTPEQRHLSGIFYSGTLSEKTKATSQPGPIHKGFFAPYPHFSSVLATPQIQSGECPPKTTTAYIFSEESVEKALSELQDASLKAKLKRVANCFSSDTHSQEIGLIVFDPPRVKLLHFSKNTPLQ